MSGHYATVQPTNWLQCRIPIKSTYQNTSCNVYTPYKYINGLGRIILFDAINKSTTYIMYNIVICFWVNLEEDSRSDWLECVPQGMRLWVAVPSCLCETVWGRREGGRQNKNLIMRSCKQNKLYQHTHISYCFHHGTLTHTNGGTTSLSKQLDGLGKLSMSTTYSLFT